MCKIKICIIGTRGIPGLQGGIERHIEKIYSRISNDIDITVFNRKRYFKEKIYLYKNIKLIYLWAPKSKFFENIIHSLFCLIIAKIKGFKIINFQSIGPSLLTPLAKLLGFKVVVTHHGPDYLRKKWNVFAKIMLRLGEIFAIKYADIIVSISDYIKNYLENKYNRKDIIVIRNGIEFPSIVNSNQILKKFNLEKDKFILMVSRFVPEKGLHDVINAYNMINNPNFKLVIVGDSEYNDKYSKRIKSLCSLNRNIILTGILKENEIYEFYSNTALFILASYYEGLPIALLEALSFGLPVLVSDIPQHREIPLPEFRYFPIGNINILSQKLVELFNLGISENEKSFITDYLINNYNWDSSANKFLEIYRNL